MPNLARYLRGFARQKPGPWSRVDWTNPLSSGLVGYWLANEAGGTRLVDLSYHGNTGILSGTALPNWAPGFFNGPTLNYNGSTVCYTNCGSSTTLSPLTAITLIAWIKGSSFSHAYNCVVSRIDPSATPLFYYQIQVKSTGKMAMFVHAGAIDKSYDGTGSNTLSTGSRYQVVLTYDTVNGLKGYVNASLDGTATANGNLDTGVANLSIGSDLFTAGRDFAGIIDVVSVYNRALTQKEITKLYYSPFEPLIQPPPKRAFSRAITPVGTGGFRAAWARAQPVIGVGIY